MVFVCLLPLKFLRGGKKKAGHPTNLRVLFSRCLIKDFEARPSVTHLLEHPFIKQAHGKEAALRQQLAALIREQQQEAGSRTKTRYILPSNYQEITACGATGEHCCIRGAAASLPVFSFFSAPNTFCPAGGRISCASASERSRLLNLSKWTLQTCD